MSPPTEPSLPTPPSPREAFRPIRRLLLTLRNRLLTGILVAVPLVVTFWVLTFTYNTISQISDPMMRLLRIGRDPDSEAQRQVLGFFLTLLVFLFIGFMATNVLGQRIIEALEKFLLKVPFVATIYAGVKQVIDSIRNFNVGMNFKRVVYVDYPQTGHRLIGFMTGSFYDPKVQSEMVNVFVPTAPNPMTGLLIVVNTKHVQDSNLTMEQASKLILSAGLIGPKFDPDGVPIPGMGTGPNPPENPPEKSGTV